MLAWLRSLFVKEVPVDAAFVWCLVGNVKESKKHFAANAKVYCLPAKWGDGYENIRVIGLHKKAKRMILLVMDSKFIHNWRKQKVYDPKVIRLIQKENGFWTNPDDIDRYVERL